MTYDVLGPGALDYLPCRYGTSKLLFRGPEKPLGEAYIAFIGGLQTFGRFIEQPYPLKIEHLNGVRSVNFGQANAGIDVFALDPMIPDVSRGARAIVQEVIGACNMSNAYYAVHPRRNDRFVSASPKLCRLFPDVDFAEFSFTYHMLQVLFDIDPDRFAVLRGALQDAWVNRMRQHLRNLGGRAALLWMNRQAPPECWAGGPEGFGPTFVTRPMLDAVQDVVAAQVLVSLSPKALSQGTEGMVFNPLHRRAAEKLLGPRAHGEVADALRPVLDRLMAKGPA